MRGFSKDEAKGPFILSAGWLFADLLLAVAMLFLAANTVSIPKPPATPVAKHPTHVPSKPTQTPTPNPRVLEHNYCRIPLNISDLTGFQNSLSSAENQLEPQLNAIDQHGFLRGRKVGIAIAYGGANDGNEGRGVNVANQTYGVLRDLATRNTPFAGTSFYDNLFTRLFSPNTVIIDVYLVVRPGQQNSETCDSNHNPI
jgi:hypothetical protein